MNIFCVSPQYLKALHRESKEYKFNLQGYGSLKLASLGLMKTNASEIYGFSYVANSLPNKSASLKKFLEMCDMVSEYSEKPKRFVFCLKDDTGISTILDGLKIDHMEVFLTTFEELTDVVIRREVFGTILESYLNPFETSRPSEMSSPVPLKTLKYVSIFPPRVLKALGPVNIKDTLESTLIEDEFLEENKNNRDFLFYLRMFGIKMKFGDAKDRSKELDELLEQVKDPKLKASYSLLYSYVRIREIQEVRHDNLRRLQS